MSTKIFSAVAGLVIFCSWTAQRMNGIGKAAWLTGTWESKTQKGSIYETWVKVSDGELFGKSYMLKGKDTVVFETISLIQQGDSLFYVPVVKNQNGGLPVRFGLKTISDTAMVFENPQHDFPQIISYTRINSGSLVAEIAGARNGKERKQVFPMKRVK